MAAGLLSCAATTQDAVIRKLRPRAAFDLDCPPGKIHIREIGGNSSDYAGGIHSYGATGCGQRIRYETRCSAMEANCLITADTASRSRKASKPKPKPNSEPEADSDADSEPDSEPVPAPEDP